MIQEKIEKTHVEYVEYVEMLVRSGAVLQVSYDVCKDLSLLETFDELESAEAFTARFARTVDIVTIKVMRSFIARQGEDVQTFIDAVHFLKSRT